MFDYASPTRHRAHRHYCALAIALGIALLALYPAREVSAHPLGNFTTNHFVRIEVEDSRLRIRYVVDMAEIPAFQQSQEMDGNSDGTLSDAERDDYLRRTTKGYAAGLVLTVDGMRVPIEVASKSLTMPPGAGGLKTLRVECDLIGAMPASDGASASRRIRFEDTNHRERSGWRELVVVPASGMTIFDSSAYGNAVTDEIKKYPEDMLTAPLNERSAELSFARGIVAPQGSTPLMARNGRPASTPARDYFAELIAVPELTPGVALLGLLIAAALGSVHALSPGHGKTVVGAYLVGSRGTPRHAAFLGLTVTITHTAGVIALGVVTLFLSQYIVPERLFPILSLISGAIVMFIGLSLFVQRLRAAFGYAPHDHHHHHGDNHSHAHTQHSHAHDDSSLTHTHGGSTHTHLPPGADGSPVTWGRLLALGISGGLLPCPSALVVMLSAIALQRVGYGLILVVAFSIGLAATLTGIGLAFVYAGRWMKSSTGNFFSGHLIRVLPILSALVISGIGAVLCYESLGQTGFDWRALLSDSETQMASMSIASVLFLGFVLGLKHATEADHLAAVSTIVSERKSLLGSSLVGGLWGVGHTISLFIAGIAVILLHIKISERMALALEFCVGIMLVALGLNVLRKLLRPGGQLHFHVHRHGGHRHVHPHLHDGSPDAEEHTHHGFRLSVRPVIIGMIHGMAGSAALMLLVLSAIQSPLVGLVYILLFGVGSIGGMMLMSVLVGLPVYLTAGRFDRANFAVRGLSGVFSVCFGLFMVYEIGFTGGLFR